MIETPTAQLLDHVVVYSLQYLLLWPFVMSEVRYVMLGRRRSSSHGFLSVCLVFTTLAGAFVASYRLVREPDNLWREVIEAGSMVALLFLQIWTIRYNVDHVYLFSVWTLRLLALSMDVVFDHPDAYDICHTFVAVLWLCECAFNSIKFGLQSCVGDEVSPEPNLIRRLLFSWLDQTYKEAHRGSSKYREGKLFGTLREDRKCETLLQLYGRSTMQQGYTAVSSRCESANMNCTHPFTIRRLLLPFQKDIIMTALNRFLLISLYFLFPYLLRALLEENQARIYQKWIVTTMFAASMLIALLNMQYQHATHDIGLRVQSILMGAIYRSMLIEAPAPETSSAKLTTDTGVFVPFVQDLHMIWSGPLIIAVTFGALFLVIGLSGIVGLFIMFAVILLTEWLAKKFSRQQAKVMQCKDDRVKLTTDSIEQIKQIKSDQMEEFFEQRIGEHRGNELRYMRSSMWYDALKYTFSIVTPMIVACGTFLFMFLIGSGSLLTVQSMFVAIALFNLTRFPMSQIPNLLTSWKLTETTLNRINRVVRTSVQEEPASCLQHTELKTKSQNGGLEKLQDVVHSLVDELEGTVQDSRDDIIKLEAAEFSIGDKVILRDINVKLRKGTITAITGIHGAGKSTLLRAMIGTVNKTAGKAVMSGNRIAYCSQTPWIHSGTIRSNILFGEEYDQARYDAVIHACCLEEDFASFTGFDERIVNEGGHSLSGGQARRVSLARAVYRCADLYLFDDPLRSLDPNVSRKVFDRVFNRSTGLLAGCTCIFVSHEPEHLSVAESILVMSGGVIDNVYTSSQVDGQLIAGLNQEENRNKYIAEYRRKSKRSKEPVSKGDDSKRDNVSMELYVAYGKALKWNYFSAVVFLEVVVTVLDIVITVLLAQWAASQKWTHDKLLATGPIVLVWSACVYLKTVILQLGGLSLAKSIHTRLISTILRQPMTFFDSNDSGAIVNRFSNDLNILDARILTNVRGVLSALFSVLGTLGVSVYKLFEEVLLFALMGIFALLLIYGLHRLLRYHLQVARTLKRFEANSRSPIILQYNETIQGFDTIKAHDAEDRFLRQFQEQVDKYQQYVYYNNSTNRWIGVRLEFIGAIVIYYVALLTVSYQSMVGLAFVGIIISYVLRLIPSLNNLFRTAGLLEENIISFERITQYLNLSSEKLNQTGVDFPTIGPERLPVRGPIEYRDVSLTHVDGSTVLHNITLTIGAGEKLGIVGRTGSGKSSLIGTLFRFYPEQTTGNILICGVDLEKMSLEKLRRSLTLVPQSSRLFSGLVQSFIDPWKIYSVDRLNSTLRECGLSDISLGATLQELSEGQCQLLCLVRGLLLSRSIIILDEATSALNSETEDLILKLLREQFQDRTVLMIAHHLNTVEACDRILWLHEGLIRKIAPLKDYTDEERNELGFRD
ncbi:ATP-binding cassette sub-family C member 3-like [Anopheles nili]|uniref:ATP-binding cassette sub-family C member 3-like n=1 Tax=Anopheles nili TaxID=185578 RepID=UPI00237C4465|nr:ATP-binding cassette sub-family C member 3-like [Anopheles nili]